MKDWIANNIGIPEIGIPIPKILQKIGAPEKVTIGPYYPFKDNPKTGEAQTSALKSKSSYDSGTPAIPEPPQELKDAVEVIKNFSELSHNDLNMQIKRYSAGMMARLAFGVTLAIDFDIYLVDEITEVGDARFRAKSARAFRDRLSRSSIILVSHSSTTIRSLCDCSAILWNAELYPFETVSEGMKSYAELMGVADA
jgi:ABC-type dipeptide/oligopeptide/nickel transport system ATPase component